MSHLGLGERLDGGLIFEDVSFRGRQDVQNLILYLLQRTLVFRPGQDKFVLLLFEIRALVLHHYAKQLLGNMPIYEVGYIYIRNNVHRTETHSQVFAGWLTASEACRVWALGCNSHRSTAHPMISQANSTYATKNMARKARPELPFDRC